jgi:hypothetical protein
LVRASGLGLTSGHDQTLYLVVNNFGNLGTAFPETDLGEAAEYITELPKAGARRRRMASRDAAAIARRRT